MASHTIFLLFFFLLHFSLSQLTTAQNINNNCDSLTCTGATNPPPVHFPFRLTNRNSSQPNRCSYRTGFDLSCNNQNQTIIRLSSGEFAVHQINYEEQSLFINDPSGCLPKQFMNRELDFFNTFPFVIDRVENYTFLNCSKDFIAKMKYDLNPISCLSDDNGEFSVFAVPTMFYYYNRGSMTVDSQSFSPSPSESPLGSCSEISTAMVPRPYNPFFWPGTTGDIQLWWVDPNCRDCLARGGDCGCSVSPNGSNHGLPRGAKYGIIIGVGIPGLLCIIGLASFLCGRVRACGQRRQRRGQPFSEPEQPMPVVVVMGYDGPTIESFPKIELGESKRLPKPNDNTCPICLCEYEPKETLRTIPECNHYYHAGCVDEWLKMNATCPLCRNSPDTDNSVTSASSQSSSSHLVSPSTSISSSSSSLQTS
ncbi:hypothetical protein F8388_014669 [Cannabis sativa]|uniref:RING-type E3 ubiquitin transferase n=1 Tax=Cannabis sativa TaxID=3483 RepID=A0A7J6E4E5_CANSA|nr:hypothetical protein F8388_014669 [Cannabis sativa]